MKLIRFGEFRQEKPGLLDVAGQRRDCSAHFADWNDSFFESGGLAQLAELDVESLPLVDEGVRWGSCVARPRKLLCIGLNYADHAAESGDAVPTEPLLFTKGTNTVVGPYDDIQIPRRSQKTDWEVELAVVIGRETRYLESVEQAANAIAGFCVANDVSEREFQKERGGQMVKGKSCDTFCPLGPWLVTPDEIADVNNLDLTLSVNGERRQTGNTSKMVFDPYFLIHYLSQFITLEPGDVLSTGTPPGVGLGMKPPQFLSAGDVCELTVAGLGTQRQTCRAAE